MEASLRPSVAPGRTGWLMARAQWTAALIVVLLCALAPRPGQAVLLVPVGARHVDLRADLTGMAVLRAGRLRGSLLVRFAGDVPVAGLLWRGVVPLNAPAWLCASGG